MKNLGFLLGTFLFIFSFCQTPQVNRTPTKDTKVALTQVNDIECRLRKSEVVGYLDFVRCYPELGYCAHFMIPENITKVKDIPLGTTAKISGRFSMEGAATGRKYYYLQKGLIIK